MQITAHCAHTQHVINQYSCYSNRVYGDDSPFVATDASLSCWLHISITCYPAVASCLLATFRVRRLIRSRGKMYISHGRLCVCLSVPGRILTLLRAPGCSLAEWWAKKYRTPWGVLVGCSSPLLRPWARRWVNQLSLWRMENATPDLRLPSQSQDIAASRLVPNYTAWWQRHMVRVWTTCPRSLLDSETAWSWTRACSSRKPTP